MEPSEERQYLVHVELPSLIEKIVCLSGGTYVDKDALNMIVEDIKKIVDVHLEMAIKAQLLLYCRSYEVRNDGGGNLR